MDLIDIRSFNTFINYIVKLGNNIFHFVHNLENDINHKYLFMISIKQSNDKLKKETK